MTMLQAASVAAVQQAANAAVGGSPSTHGFYLTMNDAGHEVWIADTSGSMNALSDIGVAYYASDFGSAGVTITGQDFPDGWDFVADVNCNLVGCRVDKITVSNSPAVTLDRCTVSTDLTELVVEPPNAAVVAPSGGGTVTADRCLLHGAFDAVKPQPGWTFTECYFGMKWHNTASGAHSDCVQWDLAGSLDCEFVRCHFNASPINSGGDRGAGIMMETGSNTGPLTATDCYWEEANYVWNLRGLSSGQYFFDGNWVGDGTLTAGVLATAGEVTSAMVGSWTDNYLVNPSTGAQVSSISAPND